MVIVFRSLATSTAEHRRFSKVSAIGGHIAIGVLRESVMSLLLILIILLVLFGGGGLYLGGPRTGVSLGGLILIVIVIMAVTGRL